MIIIGSRYEVADVVPVLTARSSAANITVLRPPLDQQEEPVQHFFWTDGDRLDLLSERKYGTPRDWWRVLDANPRVLNPLDLRPGVKVLLP